MKTVGKKILFAATTALASATLFATDYYWLGATSDPTLSTNWALDFEGTIPASSITFDTSTNIALSNGTITTGNWALSGNNTIGNITNQRTNSSLLGTNNLWNLYLSGGNSTWTVGNILQDSASFNTRIRKSSGATGFALNTNNVTVNQGTLWLGLNTSGQNLTALTVNGTTTVGSGATLSTTVFGTGTFTGNVTSAGTLTFNLSSASNLTFKDITATGSALTFQPFTISDVSTATTGIPSISTNKISAGASTAVYIGGMGTAVDYTSTVLNKVLSFSATDFETLYQGGAMYWKVGNFSVKANESVAGSTGTFKWDTGSVNGRIRIVADNFDADNMILGNAENVLASNYYEMFRGNDVGTTSAAGTVNIGKLTSYSNDLRVGYMYNSSNNNISYIKYDSINIGTADIYYGGVFVADDITIGTLNKKGSANRITLGYSGSVSITDRYASNVTIGTTSGVSTIEGGIVNVATLNARINGELIIKSAAGLSSSDGETAVFQFNPLYTSLGDAIYTNLSADTITINSESNKSEANLSWMNTSATNVMGALSQIRVDTVNFIGTNSAYLRLNSADTRIENVNVKNVSSEAVTASAVIFTYSDTSFGAFNIESGGTANTKIYIAPQNGSAVAIDEINMGTATNFSIGITDKRASAITIGDINMDSSTAAAGINRHLYLYGIDTSAMADDYYAVNITNFNVSEGIGRAYIYSNTRIENMNISTAAASALETPSGGAHISIGALTKNDSGDLRIGSATDSAQYVRKLTVDTLTFNKNAVNIYNVQNATTPSVNIGTLNMSASSSSATALYLANDAALGSVNLSSTSTGNVNITADGLLSVSGDITSNAQKAYIRAGALRVAGALIVNGGTLYASADASGSGIAAVRLNGGAIGAIGVSSDIGTINAGDFTWNGGTNILVDVDGASVDIIALSGNLIKGADTGDYTFAFTFGDSGVIAEQEYKIISLGDTSFSDFGDGSEFAAYFENSSDYTALFDVRSDGVYVTFSAIPEPAGIAVLAGALALLLAAWRKLARKR